MLTAAGAAATAPGLTASSISALWSVDSANGLVGAAGFMKIKNRAGDVIMADKIGRPRAAEGLHHPHLDNQLQGPCRNGY